MNHHTSVLIVTTRRLPILLIAFALPLAVGSLAEPGDLLASGEATAASAASVPEIRFAAPVFDFGKIGAGTVVRHNYFFTNQGTAPLIVTGVHTSCDCTTTGKWSAKVEAGKTGVIPVQFNSTGYGGAIKKWIMVTSNDPAHPKVELALKGVVSNPVEISPPNVVFRPVAGTSAGETKVVHIANNTKQSLVLAAPKCTNRTFTVELTTVHAGKDFELHVTAAPPFRPGTAVGLISIKTNLSQVPVITVTALAVVRKQVTALPTQIWLPAGPLPSAFRTRVTIRSNSGTAGFVVSDPVVNLRGVGAVVQRAPSGRAYDVLLTFPAGLELPADSRAQLRVKTTHRQFPVITVPIHQNSREAAPPAPGPTTGRQPVARSPTMAGSETETSSAPADPAPGGVSK